MICNPVLSFLRESFCNESLRGVKGGGGGGRIGHGAMQGSTMISNQLN